MSSKGSLASAFPAGSMVRVKGTTGKGREVKVGAQNGRYFKPSRSSDVKVYITDSNRDRFEVVSRRSRSRSRSTSRTRSTSSKKKTSAKGTSKPKAKTSTKGRSKAKTSAKGRSKAKTSTKKRRTSGAGSRKRGSIKTIRSVRTRSRSRSRG